MLDMLRKLLQQEGVASKLCSLGMVSALEVLRDTGSPEVQRGADRTMTALIQTSFTLPHQPVSPNESPQHIPRSRCQSNSPVLPDPVHKQHLLRKLGRIKHDRISHSSDSLENLSHAFGSQQGVVFHGCSSPISLHQAVYTVVLATSLAGTLLCCYLSLLAVQKYLPLVVSSALHQKQRVAMLLQAMKQQLVHHVEHNGGSRHRQ